MNLNLQAPISFRAERGDFSTVVQVDFVEFEVWNEKINDSKACGTNNMQPPNLIHSEKFAFKVGDKSKSMTWVLSYTLVWFTIVNALAALGVLFITEMCFVVIILDIYMVWILFGALTGTKTCVEDKDGVIRWRGTLSSEKRSAVRHGERELKADAKVSLERKRTHEKEQQILKKIQQIPVITKTHSKYSLLDIVSYPVRVFLAITLLVLQKTYVGPILLYWITINVWDSFGDYFKVYTNARIALLAFNIKPTNIYYEKLNYIPNASLEYSNLFKILSSMGICKKISITRKGDLKGVLPSTKDGELYVAGDVFYFRIVYPDVISIKYSTHRNIRKMIQDKPKGEWLLECYRCSKRGGLDSIPGTPAWGIMVSDVMNIVRGRNH